jgi:hypothetical protein
MRRIAQLPLLAAALGLVLAWSIANAQNEPAVNFIVRFAPTTTYGEVVTPANAIAHAVLVGDTLTISGHYIGLTSPIQNVLGGVHLHTVHESADLGPLVCCLRHDGGMDGFFDAVVELTPGQRDMLLAGDAYMDIHTLANPGGEVQGSFKLLIDDTRFM